MKIIGITGGIGSGKSTVSEYLKDQGYRIIDADRISHELSVPGSILVKALGQEFGQDLINEKGVLNRKKLGERAFSTPEGKAKLDEITHKEIIKRIKEEIQKAKDEGLDLVFLDVVLLFEVALDKECDETWVVDAKEDTRIRRVIGRDGYIPEEIRKRMRSQMDSDEKKNKATHVLNNDGTLEALYYQIEKRLLDLKK
ncbi:MAG: dephospho-CoA kinase [Anaerovoracaceae bacterium]|jgi:dephospho-CoA kinase|nr:dephospho-CoA kinase [Anaerovoracaceae bacterium]